MPTEEEKLAAAIDERELRKLHWKPVTGIRSGF